MLVPCSCFASYTIQLIHHCKQFRPQPSRRLQDVVVSTFTCRLWQWLTPGNSNILFLPFRRTHSISLSTAIRQYISTKYDQHPDMFKHDLETIDRLRADAVNSLEPHVSGIRKLAAYAAQLVWIGGKFPIDVSKSRI